MIRTVASRLSHVGLWSAETHFAGCLSEDCETFPSFAEAREEMARQAEAEAEAQESYGDSVNDGIASEWRTLADMIRQTEAHRPVAFGTPHGTLMYELSPVTQPSRVVQYFRDQDTEGLVGIPDAAIVAWLENGDVDCDTLVDAYRGEWSSMTAYVDDLLGQGCIDGYVADSTAARYFDSESFGIDMLRGGDCWVAPNPDNNGATVFVFDH